MFKTCTLLRAFFSFQIKHMPKKKSIWEDIKYASEIKTYFKQHPFAFLKRK